MMKKTPPLNTLALFVFTLGLAALSAPAATIGYWRFESSPGFLADSGTNGLTLTNSGSNAVTNPALAGSGATSDFFNPIPQTGQSNGKVADFGNSSNLAYLAHADSAAFEIPGSFTVESMFNRGETGNRYIASQWTSGERSWAFGAGTNNLLLLLSTDGDSGGPVIFSTLSYTRGDDYYAAVSFDITTKNVTFYLQNLTTGGALQSETVASGLSSGVHDSTAAFNIGALGGTDGGVWSGSIDEVRLSNSLLPQSQLLASVPVPEPGTVALLSLGGMTLLVFGRSRRLLRF